MRVLAPFAQTGHHGPDVQGHYRKHLGLAKGHRQRATTPERLMWMNLRNSIRGPKFRRQVPIGGYILDLYCPKARLCVEADGPHHELQRPKDKERDRALAQKMILTIRFSSDEIWASLDWVVEEIVRIANQRIAFFEREGKWNLPEE